MEQDDKDLTIQALKERISFLEGKLAVYEAKTLTVSCPPSIHPGPDYNTYC